MQLKYLREIKLTLDFRIFEVQLFNKIGPL
jgi:hypothetical protein